MDRLEESISGFINQWKHCDKQLSTANPNIACGCGEKWPWVNTLGETMEMLEWSDVVTKRDAPPVSDEQQPGLTF